MASVLDLHVGAVRQGRWSAAALRWSAVTLVAVTWISAAVFGAYIVAFFGGTALRGAADRWNESLPALYDRAGLIGTLGIGAHFIAGGVLLLLGPVQLLGRVRRSFPAVHRWVGRVYVCAAGLAGLGGLGFIASRGTVGGPVMDAGFGLYGVLMTLAAALTYAHARAGRFEAHRAWAIRLFALTIGSWLYRIEYGFWFLVVGRIGHTAQFSGWFDVVMVFFFYLPNLAVAEMFIRTGRRAPGRALAIGAAGVLAAASGFIVLATCFFTIRFWGPGMVSGLTGSPLPA